jgi:hypothetical protein
MLPPDAAARAALAAPHARARGSLRRGSLRRRAHGAAARPRRAPGASDDRGKHRGRDSGARSAHVGLFLHGRCHGSGPRAGGARGPRRGEGVVARGRPHRVVFPELVPDRSVVTRRRWRSIHSRCPLEDKMAELERPVLRDARQAASGFNRRKRGWSGRASASACSRPKEPTRSQSLHVRRLRMAVIAIDDAGRAQRRSYPTWQGRGRISGRLRARGRSSISWRTPIACATKRPLF